MKNISNWNDSHAQKKRGSFDAFWGGFFILTERGNKIFQNCRLKNGRPKIFVVSKSECSKSHYRSG